MTRFLRLVPLLAMMMIPLSGSSHESFLPLHDHSGHDHTLPVERSHSDGKVEAKRTHQPESSADWFVFATGARYTRYSVDDASAHLWETGYGVEYALTPRLRIGGDISYGWFDSEEGRADGWLRPRAHLDFHLPFARRWELLAGLEVGFPGGDEALVGKHWEWVPHAALRYDRGNWFAEFEFGLTFIHGETEHDDHHESADGDAEHFHEADFHDIVEPHGECELGYSGAAGVRVLDRRLTLEAGFSAVRVLAGETPAENYLRTGFRASWVVNERVLISAEGNIPLTDARRNEWQASAGLRIGF